MKNRLRVVLMIIFFLVVVGAIIGLDAKIFVLNETITTQQKHIEMLQSARAYILRRVEKLQESIKTSSALIDRLAEKNSSLEGKSQDLEGMVQKLRDDMVALSQIAPKPPSE